MSKTKNLPDTTVISNWVEEFANFIAAESYKLVVVCGKPKGLSVISSLSTKFLKYYIYALVIQSLKQHADEEDTQRGYDLTKDSFLDVKSKIQAEISAGFEKAIREFSGRNVEYYCQVKPSPEAPKNGATH